MASIQTQSPGASLLRSSRLFSLPAPIPPPRVDKSLRFGSATATKTFPTHQAVTTPWKSRQRGDWGFKRPLPLKSTTKSTNPTIRVHQVDSVERITDFSSASDHCMTLQKWQELNMPITFPRALIGESAASSYGSNSFGDWRYPTPSVFEEQCDVTALDPRNSLVAQSGDAAIWRWKFKGPWLSGMSEGKLEKYATKVVRPKRPEFMEFLRHKLAVDKRNQSVRELAEKGVHEEGGAQAQDGSGARLPAVTDDELSEFVRYLRRGRALLLAYVGEFLDLAPLSQPNHKDDSTLPSALFQSGGPTRKGNKKAVPESPWAKTGPPVTHPSAGLSYLRTRAFLPNHPIYGPQHVPPPVEARVLTGRLFKLNLDETRLGLAGFVCKSSDSKLNPQRSPRLDDEIQSEINIPGQVKIWALPKEASIQSDGSVQLTIDETGSKVAMSTEQVAKEWIGQEDLLTQTARPEPLPLLYDQDYSQKSYHKNRRNNHKKVVVGSQETYGLKGSSWEGV